MLFRSCKREIADLKTTRSLEKVLRAQPKYYKRVLPKNPNVPIAEEDAESYGIGLIAQDVLTYNPHCVGKWTDTSNPPDGVDESDYKGEERFGINYRDWTIHNIGAIQELHKMIVSQQETIDSLIERDKVVVAHAKQLETDFNLYKQETETRLNKLAGLVAQLITERQA